MLSPSLCESTLNVFKYKTIRWNLCYDDKILHFYYIHFSWKFHFLKNGNNRTLLTSLRVNFLSNSSRTCRLKRQRVRKSTAPWSEFKIVKMYAAQIVSEYFKIKVTN